MPLRRKATERPARIPETRASIPRYEVHEDNAAASAAGLADLCSEHNVREAVAESLTGGERWRCC